MAKLDNPAGRLHTLLTAYTEQAASGGSILGTWAQVFRTETDDATLARIAATGALVTETQRALERVGDEDQLNQFHDFAGDWIRAVLSPRVDMVGNAAANSVPDRRVLNALAGTSSYLSGMASEGPVPSREQQTDAYQQILDALSEVRSDSKLPPELRRELLGHLQRVLDALGTFQIDGPDAVQAALARLSMSVFFAPEAAKKTSALKKVAAAGGAVWVVFTSGPTVQAAIEAWGQIVQALPPGTP